ncbi:MAG: ParB/RepB/Spo0J family partition protein [Verrucomicrobiota bacterium]
MAKPALGRGLGALLGGAPPATKTSPATTATTTSLSILGVDARERVQRIPLSRVRPCPFQPRKDFTEDSLRELADSIREQGIVQPLLVRTRGDSFELIAGERRWRAAQIAGLSEVPVIVREADDREVLELALIENLQRENLNPLEEALGYSQLISQFHLTQEEAAVKVGKSRAVVANALRLLKLPAEVQDYLRKSLLSVGHAKVILGLNLPQEQALAAQRVLKDGLNVRQTEELVAQWQARSPLNPAAVSGKKTAFTRDTHVTDLENRLTERLGTKVSLRYRQGKGSVEIRFFSDDELERVLELLGISPE